MNSDEPIMVSPYELVLAGIDLAFALLMRRCAEDYCHANETIGVKPSPLFRRAFESAILMDDAAEHYREVRRN